MNRYAWLKAVGRQKNLPKSALQVAMALALEFYNEETGQLNPGDTKLAQAMGDAHPDTVKRGIKALHLHGWLAVPEGRRAGRGRGKKAWYVLTSPDGWSSSDTAKIIEFGAGRRAEKGERRSGFMGEKGERRSGFPDDKTLQTCAEKPCNPADKTLQSCSSHIRNQQYLNNDSEQGSFRDQPCPVDHIAVALPGSHRVEAWNAWLADHGWPILSELGQRASDTSGAGWRVPFPLPPNPAEGIKERITEKYLVWAAARLEDKRKGVA